MLNFAINSLKSMKNDVVIYRDITARYIKLKTAPRLPKKVQNERKANYFKPDRLLPYTATTNGAEGATNGS